MTKGWLNIREVRPFRRYPILASLVEPRVWRLALVGANRVRSHVPICSPSRCRLSGVAAGEGAHGGRTLIPAGPISGSQVITANALRDWCGFNQAGTSYIEPGSPWQNPYVESFGGRLRDELLAVEAFSSLLEARALVEDWRI